MPSVDEIRQTVCGSSPDDWKLHKCDFGMLETADYKHITWVYERDVELRIERGRNVDWSRDSGWSEHTDMPVDDSYRYWVIYSQSPVSSHVLVSVDEYQAAIAIPASADDGEPWTISDYENRLGAIVSGDDEEYEKRLRATDIEVV